MGGKSLMMNKKIWLGCLVILPLYADLSIGQMETMVEKIKAKRAAAQIEKDPHFTSPFVMIQQDDNRSVIEDPKSNAVAFTLGALINNKAFLNERWVKVGDKIEGYELTEIKDNSVTLVQEERTIQVFLKKSKPILQLNEG
jgi:hypothetical protein